MNSHVWFRVHSPRHLHQGPRNGSSTAQVGGLTCRMLALAAPSIVFLVSGFGIQTVAILFISRLGQLQLSAAALAISVCNTTGVPPDHLSTTRRRIGTCMQNIPRYVQKSFCMAQSRSESGSAATTCQVSSTSTLHVLRLLQPCSWLHVSAEHPSNVSQQHILECSRMSVCDCRAFPDFWTGERHGHALWPSVWCTEFPHDWYCDATGNPH